MIETLTANPVAAPRSENRLVRVEGLVKRFGGFTTVDNRLIFDLREGEIFAFLGIFARATVGLAIPLLKRE